MTHTMNSYRFGTSAANVLVSRFSSLAEPLHFVALVLVLAQVRVCSRTRETS